MGFLISYGEHIGMEKKKDITSVLSAGCSGYAMGLDN
jgi:hypothetical protein